jgi:hypothetical protein
MGVKKEGTDKRKKAEQKPATTNLRVGYPKG